MNGRSPVMWRLASTGKQDECVALYTRGVSLTAPENVQIAYV